jgi:transposase
MWAKIQFKMAQIKSWTVSDSLWCKVEPLIPLVQRLDGRKYRRKPGAGRKPMAARQVFSAIVYVLRTGIQWKALPREFGSASAVHQHFQNWQKAGFFLKVWQAGVAEYDGMQGIAWEWQSVDGALGKAPLAQECVGPNPTDRGKKGAQTKFVSRRAWRPAVARRQRGQRG